jgi:ribonuclease HI
LLDGRNENVAAQRNAAGELAAAMRGVYSAMKMGITEITIFFDYQGVEKHATGEWKTKSESARLYHEFMQKATAKITIAFVHVDGHTGNRGNERVDAMARCALHHEEFQGL